MFEWLTGQSRSGGSWMSSGTSNGKGLLPSAASSTLRTVLNGLIGDDDNTTTIEEPPVTPAPVFAVRAFRTAIWGTPDESRETRPHGRADRG